MGRKRVYIDNADRQEAYRQRIIDKYQVSEWEIRSVRDLYKLADHFGIKAEIKSQIRLGTLTIRKAWASLRGRLAAEMLDEEEKP